RRRAVPAPSSPGRAPTQPPPPPRAGPPAPPAPPPQEIPRSADRHDPERELPPRSLCPPPLLGLFRGGDHRLYWVVQQLHPCARRRLHRPDVRPARHR